MTQIVNANYIIYNSYHVSLGNDVQSALPVAQMISENQSLHYIRFWLQTWSLSHKKPSEIVVDESSALLGACIQVFTGANCTYLFMKSQ